MRGSLPCSQEPITIRLLSQMNQIYIIPSCFFKIHFNWFSHLQLSLVTVPTFRFSNQNFVCIILRFPTCYMPCPFHPWSEVANNNWCGVKIMKLLIKQVFPSFCHLLPLRSKYPQSVIFLQCETELHHYKL